MDESGNGNTVTVATATGIQENGISNCAAVDGANAYRMATDDSLTPATAITIEAWIRFDTVPTSGRRGIIDNDGQYGFFYFGTTGYGLRFSCNACISGYAPVSITPGAWHHYAATVGGGSVNIYFDGIAVLTEACAGSVSSTGGTSLIAIMANSPSGNNIDGAIDNLRLWSDARTQLEICSGAGGGLSC